MFVIAGVSGNVGSIAAQALLDQGKQVRVIVRDAAKGARWAAAGAEVVVGSLSDVPFLTRALTGAEGAFLLVPPPPYDVPDFRAYQKVMGEALVAAAKAADVPHVVLLSSVGADLPAGTGPIAGLYPVEQGLGALRGVSFVRAAFFMENIGGMLGTVKEKGLYPTFTPAAYAFDMVSVADIGACVARTLLEGPSGRRVINLAGPAPYSPADVAQTLGALLSQHVQALELPVAAAEEGLKASGVPAEFAKVYAEMYKAFAEGRVSWQPEGGLVRGVVTLEQALSRLV